MAADPSSLSPTSRRTRRLIVDTAIDTLGDRHGATLAEIATAAGVSRSTLHRHFADRPALLAAVSAEAKTRFDEASRKARLDEGTVLDAIDRLGQEYLELGSVLALVFADNAHVDPDSWEDADDRERSMITMIERGQREQSVDPDLAPEWIGICFWGLLFSAWIGRTQGLPRREVADQFSRTLRNAFSAR